MDITFDEVNEMSLVNLSIFLHTLPDNDKVDSWMKKMLNDLVDMEEYEKAILFRDCIKENNKKEE